MKIEQWLSPENLGLIALGIVIGAVSLIGVEAACDADVAARLRAAKSFELAEPSKTPPSTEKRCAARRCLLSKPTIPSQALWADMRRRFLTPKKEEDDWGAAPDMFPSVPRTLEKRSPKLAPAPSE
jgi:hypothetical protein